MRIGVYPGTFDPIHIGHTYTAQLAAEDQDLQLVIMVPAFCNPHKVTSPPSASFKDRLGMTYLALRNLKPLPNWRVDDWEGDQRRVVHTWETLLHIQRQYPGDHISLIIGADSLLTFHTWEKWEWILDNFDVIVVDRPGVTLGPTLAKIWDAVKFVRHNDLAISSTIIRERLSKHLPVTNLVTREVEFYALATYRKEYVNADYQS